MVFGPAPPARPMAAEYSYVVTRSIHRAEEYLNPRLHEELGRIDAIYPFAKPDRTGVAKVVGLTIQRHANSAGVEVVGVDGGLLVDLIRK